MAADLKISDGHPSRPAAQAKKNTRPSLNQRTASLSRWLHIYLSMISFAILFFFAVTGLTLNHTEWFGDKQQTVQRKGVVDLNWVRPGAAITDPNAVAKLEIVEFLRRTHGVKGALSDFRVDESQCAVSFKGPGYTADSFIDRATGAYELTETRMGFVAVINDLHKGRDTGPTWSIVIDLSAILMTLVSLSGMILIWFIKRRRLSGIVIAIVGGLLCYFIYQLLTP